MKPANKQDLNVACPACKKEAGKACKEPAERFSRGTWGNGRIHAARRRAAQ